MGNNFDKAILFEEKEEPLDIEAGHHYYWK
jgi:hypothetical protein